MSDVNIATTDEAQAFLDQHGGQAAFEDHLKEELASLGAGTDDGPDSIYEIFFHVISWHGDHNLILTPNQDGDCLILDLCIMQERGEIPAGPMKGKRIMMPTPYSKRSIQ